MQRVYTDCQLGAKTEMSVDLPAENEVFVAHALMRAASRLISTPKCRHDRRRARRKPTLRRAAQRVFVAIGGPRGHGNSLTAAVSFRMNERAGQESYPTRQIRHFGGSRVSLLTCPSGLSANLEEKL